MLAASRVITHPKPVYCAIYFVLVVVAVAALLVLQQAEFLAVALIIIYAGAILVTYLFVIMLAHQGGSPTYDRRAREPFLAILAAFVLMAAVAGKAADLPVHVEEPQTPVSVTSDTGSTPSAPEGNTAAIGRADFVSKVEVRAAPKHSEACPASCQRASGTSGICLRRRMVVIVPIAHPLQRIARHTQCTAPTGAIG